MNYILLLISISSMVLHNSLLSRINKKHLHSKSDIYCYNSLLYIVCTLLFAVMAFGGSISLYTVLLGFVFGLVTMLSTFYRSLALSKGPTHITILIATSSMIIPTLSGTVLFGEKFSFPKLIAMVVLIFFIYLCSKTDEETKSIGKGWVLYCGLAFLSQGIIGVIQKIHQSSEHKSELFSFLLVSFCVSFVFARILTGNRKKEKKFTKIHYIFALFSGVCMFTMNYLNLKLSGLLPSQLFFPAVNGSSLILTTVVAVVLFKETLTRRQVIGVVGGLLSLIAICIL